MRFQLILEHQNGNNHVIPFNYQYFISSWIYKLIASADKDYASWLHNQGYTNGGRFFKMFCFSRLTFPPKSYRVRGDVMEINQAQMTLEISMYAEKAAQTFIEGVFQEQSFYINHGQYRQNYKVRSIKVMETPRFENTMHYKTLSPILLSFSDENKNEVYMRPDHPEYGLKLAYNLINKLNAIQAEHQITENDISFLLTGDFKKNGITIKENSQNPTQLIGYLFPFTLKAPPEIHEIAYNAGVGKENSQGFGCVEIVTQNRNQHG